VVFTGLNRRWKSEKIAFVNMNKTKAELSTQEMAARFATIAP
jgi:hypothetical protein